MGACSMDDAAADPVSGLYPRRVGLKFDPPSMIFECYEPSNKKRVVNRCIRFRHLSQDSDATRVAASLRKRNAPLLGEDKIGLEQLASLVRRLQCALAAPSPPSSASASSNVSVPATPPDSPGTLEETPSDVPDADVDAALASPGAHAVASTSRDAPDSYEVDPELNLNQLSTEELDKHKVRMDVGFLKNQKRPGDPDFVYDVRIDHGPMEECDDSCGWDDSEED